MEYNEEVREVILEQPKSKWGKDKEKGKGKGNYHKNIWIWIAIILAIFCVGYFINQIVNGEQNRGMKNPYIGVVSVEGEIGPGSVDNFGIPYGYQHQWTLTEIDELIDDHNNKGMVVFVNSPGGGVYESDELYLKIKQYQELTKRPVYAAMGSMAASGGYYISAPADKIYANRNTWTGSIGVTIGTMFDLSNLLEKYGIKTVTIAEGRNKAMGSSTETLTKEQEDILRGLVHEAYQQFTSIVSTERNIDMTKVTEIADGRIYTAKQAKELKLIDGIATLDQTILKMKKDYDLEYCNVVNLEYVDNSFMGKLLGKINLKQANTNDLGIVMNLVEEQSRFPISYLYGK